MRTYTLSAPRATAPANPATSDKAHADFARSAVLQEFQPRDALRGLDQGNFQDRPPHQQPARLGDIAPGITRSIAQRAIQHWTRKAALALTPGERDEALSIARKIALKAGLEFPEDRKRAA